MTVLRRVALLGLVALSACGADEGERSTATTEVAQPEVDPTTTTVPGGGVATLDDPRLIGDFQEVELDLADPLASSEIAEVLNFSAGAGGLPFCDVYFDGAEPSVADGVGFGGDTDPDSGEALLSATVGYTAELCLAGWSREATVTVTNPDGQATSHTAGDTMPTRGPGIELHPTPSFGQGEQVVELRTFPGAPTGSYEVRIEDGGRIASFSIVVGTTQDTDRPGVPTYPLLFNIDRYADSNEMTPLQPGTVTAYAAVGYPPSTTIDLAVFRSEQPVTDAELPSATMVLVDQTTMAIDGRGEGVLAFALDEFTAGHCFYAIDIIELATADLSDGLFRDVSGLDGQSFCVAG